MTIKSKINNIVYMKNTNTNPEGGIMKFKVTPTTKKGKNFMGGTHTFMEHDYRNWLQNVIGNPHIKVGTSDFDVEVI